MLEFRNISKRYGDLQALTDVSFQVRPGRAVGFLGANGAGKTTTMRTVFGLVRPDTGETLWDGNPIDDRVKLGFGYMPEQRGLYGRMPVRDQLVFLGRLHGMTTTKAKVGADKWLERLGLDDRAGDALEKLSHGNQQRVQLAAALLHEPGLIVLDEPFSGLDPIGVDNMKEIVTEQTAGGTAVLFSSHQLDLVEDVCDDVAIIKDGEVALSGDLATVKASSNLRNVKVIGPDNGDWVESAPGVVSHAFNAVSGTHTFLVDQGVTPDVFLGHVTPRGVVKSFSYTPPTLEDIYRETVL
jgi:ABC-2 type transport system ATP-binding protein